MVMKMREKKLGYIKPRLASKHSTDVFELTKLQWSLLALPFQTEYGKEMNIASELSLKNASDINTCIQRMLCFFSCHEDLHNDLCANNLLKDFLKSHKRIFRLLQKNCFRWCFPYNNSFVLLNLFLKGFRNIFWLRNNTFPGLGKPGSIIMFQQQCLSARGAL